MIDFRFYLITDRKRCAPKSLQTVVREACDAGVRAVQLREKDLGPYELEAYVSRLLTITQDRGAQLIINRGAAIETTEDAFLSASLGAAGFHFPESATFPHELRRRFPGLTVGVSTHSSVRAVAAAAEGADFITFGPVFDTPSKTRFGSPQGIEALATVCSACPIPVFAVGGVTPENAAGCVEVGAHGVAAIGAVMQSADIEETVRGFERALGGL